MKALIVEVIEVSVTLVFKFLENLPQCLKHSHTAGYCLASPDSSPVPILVDFC